MPASLYRLAGKPHHAEVSAVQPVQEAGTAGESINAVDAQPASAQVNSVEAATIESFEENNAIVSQEMQTPEPTPEPTVEPTPQATWDVSWTKTQLLQLANEFGLNVTSTNTKTEILAALESIKTV